MGKLIYLSHTILDIGFSLSVVNQFMNSSTKEHMEAVYRIFRYLKMTPRRRLYFRKKSNKKIEVFANVDWAGSITDCRSTTGHCTFV